MSAENLKNFPRMVLWVLKFKKEQAAGTIFFHMKNSHTAGRKNGIIEILVSIDQLFVAKIAHYCSLNKAILPIPKNGLIDRGYRFLFVQ